MSTPTCHKCNIVTERIYEIDFHNIYECSKCRYQKAVRFNDCCRHPSKIVIIDNTKKIDRLLYQCTYCGGIVNRNLPLSFKLFSDQIRDEINTYRYEEWQKKIGFDYLLVKESIEENNYRFSKWGIIQ